jgi:hypothetical protein
MAALLVLVSSRCSPLQLQNKYTANGASNGHYRVDVNYRNDHAVDWKVRQEAALDIDNILVGDGSYTHNCERGY